MTAPTITARSYAAQWWLEGPYRGTLRSADPCVICGVPLFSHDAQRLRTDLFWAAPQLCTTCAAPEPPPCSPPAPTGSDRCEN